MAVIRGPSEIAPRLVVLVAFGIIARDARDIEAQEFVGVSTTRTIHARIPRSVCVEEREREEERREKIPDFRWMWEIGCR